MKNRHGPVCLIKHLNAPKPRARHFSLYNAFMCSVSLWSQIKGISRELRIVASFLKHRRKILAVAVLLLIVSFVVVAMYFGHRAPQMDQDETQRFLGTELTAPGQVPAYLKYYRVVLESIDETYQTAHLRADLRYVWGTDPSMLMRAPLFTFIDESPETHEIRKNYSAPVQIFFSPFEISDATNEFSVGVFEPRGWTSNVPLKHPPASFSESVPKSTQADIRLLGDPWLYPFDKYAIAAQIKLMIVATPDWKQYFRIPDDRYTVLPKVPNLMVRNIKANDLEYWAKYLQQDPKEFARLYKPDFWKDGRILLVLERPLFPKFFAVFFGILAVAWILVVARSADPKQLTLNEFAYFLALWAIRAPLAAGAPKAPLLMDDITMGLYVLVIGVALARFVWGFRKPPQSLEEKFDQK